MPAFNRGDGGARGAQAPHGRAPERAGVFEHRHRIATAQLCLAATAQGLSTCILGWLDGRKVCAALGLPEDTRVRLVIAVGYALPDDPLRKKQRKPLEQVLAIHE